MTNEEPPIIAIRDLRVAEGGTVATVILRTPQPDDEGEWECRFTISGLANPVFQSAYGIDAMQALILAIESIRLALAAAPESLSWEGENGDPGFPRFVPTYFGPEFSAHISRIIDAESARFSEELERKHNSSHP